MHHVTTSLQIICHSTGEAEYCTAALTIMAAANLRKAFNEIKDRPSDSPLTIPIGIDLKVTANIASSAKETKKTCHIEHHYHYFRESIQRGSNSCFISLAWTIGASNRLTKAETAEQLNSKAEIYLVQVTP
jgi:hypothetical protein